MASNEPAYAAAAHPAAPAAPSPQPSGAPVSRIPYVDTFPSRPGATPAPAEAGPADGHGVPAAPADEYGYAYEHQYGPSDAFTDPTPSYGGPGMDLAAGASYGGAGMDLASGASYGGAGVDLTVGASYGGAGMNLSPDASYGGAGVDLASAAGYGEAEPDQARLPRQRGVARGGTVLGIAAMAAVGASGVAAAAAPDSAPAGAAPTAISAPDTAVAAPPAPPAAPAPAPTDFFVPAAPAPAVYAEPAADAVPAAPVQAPADLADPDAALPHPADAADPVPAPVPAPAPALAPTGTVLTSDPGEALRARILGEVTAHREAAAQAERDAAERQAAREAAERKVREQAAEAKAAAAAKAKADAEAAAKAEAERRALLAVSYIKPLASYTLTDGFGAADPWSNPHTGQDFTAPTGTPVHAVHSGTVTSAGWAGAYGYRVVVTLDDGTQVWYCHLSTMVATEGRVTTGDTIGRVGATGNVPAPHLHLEVRPGGAAPADPVRWLHTHGVAV